MHGPLCIRERRIDDAREGGTCHTYTRLSIKQKRKGEREREKSSKGVSYVKQFLVPGPWWLATGAARIVPPNERTRGMSSATSCPQLFVLFSLVLSFCNLVRKKLLTDIHLRGHSFVHELRTRVADHGVRTFAHVPAGARVLDAIAP